MQSQVQAVINDGFTKEVLAAAAADPNCAPQQTATKGEISIYTDSKSVDAWDSATLQEYLNSLKSSLNLMLSCVCNDDPKGNACQGGGSANDANNNANGSNNNNGSNSPTWSGTRGGTNTNGNGNANGGGNCGGATQSVSTSGVTWSYCWGYSWSGEHSSGSGGGGGGGSVAW